MQPGISVDLERDCPAVQIPAGNTVVLPAGTVVEITQNLGGSLTVRALDGLFQIAGQDADALGLEPFTAGDMKSRPQPGDPLSEQMVWDALRECYDPEIPVNIVDLGLVYDLAIERTDAGTANVAVKMTLTTQGCGMGPVIAQNARDRIAALPGVASATVEMVWDPPWHPSMISPEGKRRLGIE
ncbi:MAG: putative Fe-S cluster assembly protein SufT [Verrucomicrobia bacterium]|jgi:probable FeS assembly SUF system protein SufT|nr:putative Fe-S cluster assembly protein SufT [Verrucomicrobiota bacterium]